MAHAEARPAQLLAYAYEQQNEYALLANHSTGIFSELPHSEVGKRGYNGGVGFQLLARMRGRPGVAYHSALADVLAFSSKAVQVCMGRRPVTCPVYVCGLWGLGDQTVISLAAHIAAAERWQQMVAAIPCEWNWQTSLAYYMPGALHEQGEACVRLVYTQMYAADNTCRRRPRLLHFNHPPGLKFALRHRLMLLDRTATTLKQNEKELAHALQKAYRQAGQARDACYWADRNTGSTIASRACNVHFLLRSFRHHVEAANSSLETTHTNVIGDSSV
eukprot:4179201-Prymnesium_polylepis.1